MNELVKTLSSKVLVILLFVVIALPVTAAERNKVTTDPAKFCGTWEYEGKYEGKGYLRIVKEGPDRFRFSRGYKYKGEIIWPEPMLKNARAIYLKPSNGML